MHLHSNILLTNFAALSDISNKVHVFYGDIDTWRTRSRAHELRYWRSGGKL